MAVVLDQELTRLRERLATLSQRVVERFISSVQAFESRNALQAQQVISGDEEIDRDEVELEEECLKVLALHQPVATDLRVIIATLKMTSDLERIGDLAVGIAWDALDFSKLPPVAPPIALNTLAEGARRMLRDALSALSTLDAALAERVLASDADVDRENRKIQVLLRDEMMKHSETVPQLLLFRSVARTIERIGDHATNIAEDVIYIVTGSVVRHGLQK